MVIFDTNILIEIYRGNEIVKSKIIKSGFDLIYISDISVAEFIVGAKNKDDQKQIQKQLSNFTTLPVTKDISGIFIHLYKEYTLSHRPAIPDMLIAASAIHYGLPLYTLNKKDFNFLPNLQLIK